MTEYRMIDTKRPDGCYVTFERITSQDHDSNPNDYLFQDEDYREQDQARLDAWRNDEWSFIGIQAVANIVIVRNGAGAIYTLTSPGLWGTESDSDPEYLDGIYKEECDTLKADIEAMQAPIYA